MNIDEDAQTFIGCGIFLLFAAVAFAIAAYVWRVIL